VLVMASELFADASSRAMSVIIAVSSLGGMVLPPLQGVLLSRVSPFSSAGLVALACALQLVLLQLVNRRAARAAARRRMAA